MDLFHGLAIMLSGIRRREPVWREWLAFFKENPQRRKAESDLSIQPACAKGPKSPGNRKTFCWMLYIITAPGLAIPIIYSLESLS